MNKIWTYRESMRPLIRQLFITFLFFYLLALLVEQQWSDFYASTVGVDFFLILTLISGFVLFVVGGRKKEGEDIQRQSSRKNIIVLFILTLMTTILIYRVSSSMGLVPALLISIGSGLLFFLIGLLFLYG